MSAKEAKSSGKGKSEMVAISSFSVAGKSAAKVGKALKEGVKGKTRKIWTTTKFRKPKTQTLPRTPRFPSTLVPRMNKMNDYRIVRCPHTTEAALRLVEEHNTLTFLCDRTATKPMIRSAISNMFGVKVVKVNTLVRFSHNDKKAYVKLHKDVDALETANKMGIL